MKILFCIAHIGYGGGQVTQSVRIIRELQKKNDVVLLALKTDWEVVTPPCKTIFAGKFSFPRGVFQLARAIRKVAKDYDVVMCFDGYYSFPAAFLARKKPYFLRMGMDPASFLREKKIPFSRFFEFVQMLPVRFGDCSKFIVNSLSLRKICLRYDPMVIPNGLDVSEFKMNGTKEFLRKKLALPLEKKIILLHGKFLRRKNISLLFDLIKLRDYYLLLIGEIVDRDYYNDLMSQYAMYSDRFQLLDEVHMDEVKNYLNASDIFVFPSQNEGSSNSLLEAMACGLPVVCSDIPSNRDLITNRKNGLLFGNQAELILAIDGLAKDASLAKSIGDDARAFVENNHNIKHSAMQYMKLFRRFI